MHKPSKTPQHRQAARALPDAEGRLGLAKRSGSAVGAGTPKKVAANIEAKVLEIRPATIHDDNDQPPELITSWQDGAFLYPLRWMMDDGIIGFRGFV